MTNEEALFQCKVDSYFEENPILEQANEEHDFKIKLLDSLGAVVGLAGTAVMYPVFFGLNRICGDNGPVMYPQPRYGKGGKKFIAMKFRTMKKGVDKNWKKQSEGTNGSAFKGMSKYADVYISPFHRILNRAKVDELPQSINILDGDMSLVGPRPYTPCVLESVVNYRIQNGKSAEGVLEILREKPGMLYRSQLIGRDNLDDDDRIRMERAYSRMSEDGGRYDLYKRTLFRDAPLIFAGKILRSISSAQDGKNSNRKAA